MPDNQWLDVKTHLVLHSVLLDPCLLLSQWLHEAQKYANDTSLRRNY